MIIIKKKIKISFTKWRSFCLGLKELVVKMTLALNHTRCSMFSGVFMPIVIEMANEHEPGNCGIFLSPK